jgi:uncharacterized membrane protein YfcA
MWSPDVLVLIAAVFVIAGMSKGVVGFGLPTIGVALLAATIGIKEALALILIPSLATNVWQGLAGGALGVVLRRLWTLLLAAIVGTWLGAGLLARSDALIISGVFGVLLLVYGLYGLTRPQVPSPGRWEPWLSPLFGGAAGVATGLTGSFVVPGVMYLQALNLPRDVLIQAMGVTFTTVTVVLGAGLTRHALLTPDLGLLSALALLPTGLGMVLGQRLRKALSEERFRQVFFAALLALGLYLLIRAVS